MSSVIGGVSFTRDYGSHAFGGRCAGSPAGARRFPQVSLLRWTNYGISLLNNAMTNVLVDTVQQPRGLAIPIMIIIYLTLVLLCAAHAARTGQERYWFLVILIPIVGAVLYTIVVAIPELLAGPHSLRGHFGFFGKSDGALSVREAERALAVARTPQNLYRYAAALVGQGRYRDADVFLRELSANQLFAETARFLLLDAKTHLWLGRYRQAMEALDKYRLRHERRTQTEALVLYAYAYEGLKDFDGADAVYRNSVDRIGGEELRYYYGEFLARHGRSNEAREVFEHLVTRVERMPRFYRSQQAPWVRKARLALRSNLN